MSYERKIEKCYHIQGRKRAVTINHPFDALNVRLIGTSELQNYKYVKRAKKNKRINGKCVTDLLNKEIKNIRHHMGTLK